MIAELGLIQRTMDAGPIGSGSKETSICVRGFDIVHERVQQGLKNWLAALLEQGATVDIDETGSVVTPS